MTKIKPQLTPGAVVTISRNLADIIIQNMVSHICGDVRFLERAKALIAIAHPDFRDELTFEARKLGLIL